MTTATSQEPKKPRCRNAHEPVKRYVLSQFRPGDLVPGEAELRKRLTVSHYAAARALSELTAQGFLVREPGRGTYLTNGAGVVPGAQDQTNGGGAPRVESSSSVHSAETVPGEKRVALIAGDFHYDGLSIRLLAGLSQQFRNSTVRLNVRSTNLDHGMELAELRRLPNEGFAGAIAVVEETVENLAQIDHLLKQQFPLVLVDHTRVELSCAQVSIDHRLGIQMVVRRLLALGHRRIAFISHTERYAEIFRAVSLMESGYRDALAEAGIPFEPTLLRRSPAVYPERAPTREELHFMTYVTMHELLCLPERPTAVVTLNTHFAVGAMRAALTAGLRIPQDLSFAGFSGDFGVPGLPRQFSGVTYDVNELSRLAAQLLQAQWRGEPDACRLVLIPPTDCQEGDTIAPPPNA